ncbi:MAG: hypothetical protein IJT21_03990 [Synergistaceae bacterium]|nr:hypothetical protein [Synergistaceae bacterium]
MRKILLSVIVLVLACSCAWAESNFVNGDVLVIMRAPEGVNELTSEFLNSPECAEYISSALDPIDAKLITLYDAISWADGKLHFLARSETNSTEKMIAALKANPNVITASPNRINRLRRRVR